MSTENKDSDAQISVRTYAYDFEIDVDDDTTHTAVMRLVGDGHRVLELGPATGYMSKALRDHQSCSIVAIEKDNDMAMCAAQYCERVVVGDLDTMDLDHVLGEDRFDVILAADVLEHLKDPLDVLQRLRRFLVADKGFFVVSLPNVSHGSVRLALFEGKFAYTDAGLLDRTHLRFFTKASIEQLFDDAELAIVEMHRRVLNIDASEVQFDRDKISTELVKEVEGDPDASTYQFVIKAIPLEYRGLREVQRHVRSLALALDNAEREIQRTEQEVQRTEQEVQRLTSELHEDDPQVQSLRDALAALAEREGEIRGRLIDAHDQVLRRDEHIKHLNGEFDRLRAERDDRRERAEQENQELWKAQNEAREIIQARDDEVRLLRVRLGRIVSSRPMRLWYSLGRFPLARGIVERRTMGYQEAVDQAKSRGVEHP
jgi:2-polyprenyl-3-methyl-5-hydroxy-6-metoxy-1,4-benzoquinol methylase